MTCSAIFQEMVLSAVLRLSSEEPKLFGNYDVTFLSIGTDGIDGPTDAAGAVADQGIVEKARAAGLAEMRRALAENDSYQFFSSINEGRYLIKTGHTGTNVMDVHLLAITRNGHRPKTNDNL